MASPYATNPSLGQALSWLTTHAGFPARRLPAKAELLVLLATAAREEDRAAQNREKPRFGAEFGPSTGARLRTYTLSRNHAHAVCDNSAKV